MRTIRVYADTSVFGGAFDGEFRSPTRTFFDQVRRGRFALVISAVVRRELLVAPPKVRRLYQEMLALAQAATVNAEALRLAEAYVSADILTPRSMDDALHVALATVSECSMIVSWNFRHIVHFEKIPLYNAVNRVNGYHAIDIFSPQEVIAYED